MNKRIRKILSIFVMMILICSMLVGCGKENTAAVSKENVSYLNAENINPENMMNTIKELTGEKYDGRLPGTEGNKLAAQHIADYFKEIGLENPKTLSNYQQAYTQPVIALKEAPKLQILDKKGKPLSDFNYPENFVFHKLSTETNAINMNAPLYMVDNPSMLNGNNGELKGKVLLIPWSLYDTLDIKNEPDYAQKYGALAVICEFDLSQNKLGYSHLRVIPFASWYGTGAYKPFGLVDSGTFAKLADGAKSGNRLHFSCNTSVNENETAVNVIGLIPGSDPILKDEYIIIGAHFDHVGGNMNGTYNAGALDNASGPAAMMEIARVIKESKITPKKSILFMGFNGESSGQWGSKYYCKNPIYSLEKAVMINLDMVGSTAQLPLTIAGTDAFSSRSLSDPLGKYAEKLGIKYEKRVESGSDHVPFIKVSVPAVCLINLDFKSGYHSPHDTIETVNGDRLKEIAKLVLYYIEQSAY